MLIPDVGSSRVQDMPAYNGTRESTRIMMTTKSKLDQLGPPSYASGKCSYILCFAGWLSECTASHTAQNNTLWSNVEYFHHKVCIFLLCGVQFTYTLQLTA